MNTVRSVDFDGESFGRKNVKIKPTITMDKKPAQAFEYEIKSELINALMLFAIVSIPGIAGEKGVTCLSPNPAAA